MKTDQMPEHGNPEVGTDPFPDPGNQVKPGKGPKGHQKHQSGKKHQRQGQLLLRTLHKPLINQHPNSLAKGKRHC